MSKTLGSLTVGAKIEVPVLSAYQSRFGSKIVFKIADKNHSGYPSNSVTLITDKIIQMLCFDGKEPNNANSDRQSNGNNRYLHANLRQWLNSNAAAGAWYSAQHAADAPPNATNASSNAYDGIAGFLAIFDPKFAAALLETTLTVARNTVTDGGSYETVTDKVFLASNTEVGLANENSITEGALLPLFSDNASRITQCTAAAINATNDSSKPADTSAAWRWWLRTPYSSDARRVRYVATGGTLGSSSACSGSGGVRPLCNLQSAILVSDNVNSDGNYEIIWNTAPSAPPSITAPSSAYSKQNINISWAAATDPDGDAITYIVERSYNSGSYTQVQSSAARTFAETVSTAWNTLRYRIKARDTFANESAYIYTETIPVIHNQPPAISGANADLGIKREGITHSYTVTDPDNDIVNVVERIDGKTLATKNNVTLGQSIACAVTGNAFTELTNDEHTITITATDSAGNSAVRTLTFTKAIDGFVITLTEPLEAEIQPTRVNVIVTREIPAGGTFKVEVSNNPFDVTPTWEDCTNAVLRGMAHVFENTVNAATSFGLNVRVTVGRGSALKTCWVSGIGGNFE